ncbi:MAG: hypothetical protein PHP59_02570 [Methanofollis sp.]|uniref:hypothetical protein n=1 Tax=Methanofollis sp. TaxID=2052835 RepID=UPI002624FAA1|nr:hypothetical protein [Methanofollis sp.]MDD4254242.1 hypothetical protein [Methanofollis sp.]
MAAQVTIAPAEINVGDTVTVDVKDLPDGVAFSLGIRGEFNVNPGDRFVFTARCLSLPFSLNSGEVSAYTRGTNWTGLSAKLGEASIGLSNSADENGEFRTSQAYNISSGTYDAIALEGRATPAVKSIIAEMTITGKKKGPNDGTISFALDGVERGTATVTVYINGSEALSQRIVIGSSPSPTETKAPSPGGSSGSSGPTTGPGPATTSSVDGRVSLSGTEIDGAGLLALAVEGTVPTGWSADGRAYAVTPADREFPSPAILSFRLPAADTPATIARYEIGAWLAVPSKIEGDRITTAVSRGGSYVLLVPAPASESTATTVTTTTAVMTTTTAPVTTTAAATPMAPLLPVIALAILLLGWGRRV